MQMERWMRTRLGQVLEVKWLLLVLTTMVCTLEEQSHWKFGKAVPISYGACYLMMYHKSSTSHGCKHHRSYVSNHLSSRKLRHILGIDECCSYQHLSTYLPSDRTSSFHEPSSCTWHSRISHTSHIWSNLSFCLVSSCPRRSHSPQWDKRIACLCFRQQECSAETSGTWPRNFLKWSFWYLLVLVLHDSHILGTSI